MELPQCEDPTGEREGRVDYGLLSHFIQNEAVELQLTRNLLWKLSTTGVEGDRDCIIYEQQSSQLYEVEDTYRSNWKPPTLAKRISIAHS